jgi:hypothetical protein
MIGTYYAAVAAVAAIVFAVGWISIERERRTAAKDPQRQPQNPAPASDRRHSGR